jgi:hypothetical protein
MRNRISPSACLRRSVSLMAVATVLAIAGAAHAQTGAAENGKFYTKQPTFHLPINIDDKTRNGIQEVQLYVKAPGSEWMRSQAAPPTRGSFEYRAIGDGEYWFTLMTVDKRGVVTPSDVSKAAPDEIIKVIVDTQPPMIDLQTIKLPNGELQLRCTVFDANPDPRSLRITWKGRDQMMHTLEPVPGLAGTYRIPAPEVFLMPVRVSVSDLAGNTTTEDVNLQNVPAQLPGATQESVRQPQEPLKQSLPHAEPAPQYSSTSTGSSANYSQNIMQTNATASPSLPPLPEQKTGAALGNVQRQLLNTTRASLDYRIDQVGPSGVGKVEVWMTADQGHSWQRLCEDKNRRSPTEFDLPGDGLFGVRLVVTNGNGFGGRPPAPGDQPNCWIEVDTVAPTVQLRDIEPITNGNTVDIRWTASDKNLGPEPVNLYYATRKDGTWQPLAQKVKNDGQYRWSFPRDAGGQFFIRVEVTDLAGNVTRCDSPAAIVLDMTEPRASVVGVTAVRAGRN